MGKNKETRTTESRIRLMSIESVNTILKAKVEEKVHIKIVYLRGGVKNEQIIPPKYVEFKSNHREVQRIIGFEHDIPLNGIITIISATRK